ncbi:MAG: ATP-binding protein [Candidatus Sedimenticola sp. 1PA]
MAMHIIKSSIASKLVMIVLVASFIVTLVTTALQLRNDYVSSVEQIESNFDFIGTDALGSLVESVWVINRKQIQLQLEGLVNLPDIEYLVILIDGKVTWQSGERTSEDVLSTSFPLLRSYRGQEKLLGELKVTAGLDALYQRSWQSAGKILLTNAIEIFLVAGLLLLFFHFLVSQPLGQISDYLGALDLEKESLPPFKRKAPPALNKEDEFDQVGDVINAMTQKLSAAHRELEDKVEDRTRRLRESEVLLNETGRVAKMGGWEIDVATKDVRWTSETYHIHEVPEDYKPSLDDAINFYHPDDRGKLANAVQQAMDKGIPYDMEVRFVTAKGRQLWIRTNCAPTVIEGKAVKLRGMFQDITGRKLAEERVTRLGRIVERSLNEVFVFDSTSLKFTEVNHGARTNLGYSMEELRSLTPIDIKPEFTLESFEQAIAPLRGSEKEVIIFETVHQRKDGSLYDVEVHLQLMHDETPPVFVAIIQDTTERKRMHSVMVQTEKMMSVGGLAAGMAHELNNPLGGILQGLQNVERRLLPDLEKNRQVAQELGLDLSKTDAYFDQREIKKFIRGIRESGERAALIVANMLQFSRKAESTLHPENLDQLVDQALELAAVDYDLKKKYDFRKVEITREYDSELPQVNCIASEIQQVLLNIFRNAAQAMHMAEEKAETSRLKLRVMKKSEMVCIQVEDNGPGMEEETRKKAFDPFFTTRPVGEGTGLGLSVSYFIVTQEHNGRISVDSQPGKGTTFTVCLPIE